MAKNEVGAQAPSAAQMARQEILKAKTRKEYASFRGFDLEIRQPTVTEFINANSVESGEQRDASRVTVSMLVRYTYLKGTDDRIFDDADIDTLMGMPISGEFLTLISKMNNLLDIKVEEEVKN